MRCEDGFFARLQLAMDAEPDMKLHAFSCANLVLLVQWPPGWWVNLMRKLHGRPEPREGRYEIRKRRPSIDDPCIPARARITVVKPSEQDGEL